jgi:hypothetical protein
VALGRSVAMRLIIEAAEEGDGVSTMAAR